MKFSLFGQLRGPECNRVMQQAIALRKKLEPWFSTFEGKDIVELDIALRVDGSLGSFGIEGIQNFSIDQGKVTCDLVISDQGWTEMNNDAIALIVRERVLEAITACLVRSGVTFKADDLIDTL